MSEADLNTTVAAAKKAAESWGSFSFREPLGVVAGIAPFNFPVMVPLVGINVPLPVPLANHNFPSN
nr:aldehyde dehydrogenase family protein [Paenarthrobacter nitroguajacolicus]